MVEAEAWKGTEVVTDPDETEDVPTATQAQCRTQFTPAIVMVDPAGAEAWVQNPRCNYSTWSPELNVPTVPTAVHERALTQLTLASLPPPVGVGTPVAVVQEDPPDEHLVGVADGGLVDPTPTQKLGLAQACRSTASPG